MEVINVEDTSELTCGCSSWIEHWENYNEHGARVGYCSRAGCAEMATDGCHVQKVDDRNRRIYIIPLCKACNQEEDQFELEAFHSFAPADPSLTCQAE